MKHTLVGMSVLFLMFPGTGFGQIAVRILDAPPSVYSYEPVFVVFEVRNKGAEPLVIPLEGCHGNGATVEIGRNGKPLEDHHRESHCGAQAYAWLQPGERRLFLNYHFYAGAEEELEIEAVIRSPGECFDNFVGPTRLPLPPSQEVERGWRRFACWEGEARSERIHIDVKVPTAAEDLAAADFLQITSGATIKWQHLVLKSRELLERFPQSHYTYAAMMYVGAGVIGLLPAAIKQPENPLNRLAAGAMAAHVAYLTQPCSGPERARAAGLHSWQEMYESFLARHDPPQSLKDYVEQVKRDGAAQECPEMQAEPTTGSDATTLQPSAQRSSSITADTGPSQRRQTPQPTPSTPTLGYPPPKGLGTPNMGFRTRLSLSTGSTERIFWLSLPYRYTPPDVGTPGVVDAEDLCEDFDTSAVLGILRWNEPTSTFIEHTCGAPSPFALVKGMAYGIRIGPNRSIDVAISGGHDDAYTFSIPPTSGSQMSWISLPYHLRRTRVNPLPDGFTAEDLCQQIGSTEVRAIVRHDTETGLFHAYVCGSTFQTPFLIRDLQAYGVINKPGQTITWQPEHY
ncbi:MAG: hypothetical protein HC897_15930 [Thermoanaerobaculia bacterium]|nr:hypothetical protein [Thermoanaerobaculia bacterium]